MLLLLLLEFAIRYKLAHSCSLYVHSQPKRLHVKHTLTHSMESFTDSSQPEGSGWKLEQLGK